MNSKHNNFYLTILMLWLSHFLVDFMIGVWPIYKTIAHLDIAKAGLIAASCAFVGEGLQMLFGSLSDLGYRRLLIISGLLATTSCAFLTFTQNYTYLFILYMITCIGSGAFHPSAVGLVGALSESRKGLLIAIFASGGALGLACSQIVFAKFYASFEGNTVILALPSVAVIIFLSLYKLAAPTKKVTLPTKHIDLKGFFGLFKNRNIALLYFAQVCNQSLAWGTVFLLPDVLISRGHESWICFGGGHMCFILGGALMMVPSGFLADKYSFKSIIFTASFLGMLFFYTFLYFQFLPSSTLIGVLFFMGASIQIINPMIIAYGNKLLPDQPGLVSGFLMGLAWCVSEGIGMGGGGLLTKLFTDDAPAKALSILGILFFVGIGITSLLPGKTPVQEVPELAI